MKKVVFISLMFILSVFTTMEVKAQNEVRAGIERHSKQAPLEIALASNLVISQLVITSEEQTFIVDANGDILTSGYTSSDNLDIQALAGFELDGVPGETISIEVDDAPVHLGPGDEFTFDQFQAPEITLGADGQAELRLGFRLIVDANAALTEGQQTFKGSDVIKVTAFYID